MSLRLVGPYESLGERDLRVRPLRPVGLCQPWLCWRPPGGGAGEPCDGPTSLKSDGSAPREPERPATARQLVHSSHEASLLSPMPGHSLGQFKDPLLFICSCGSLFYRPSGFFPPVSPLSHLSPCPCPAVSCCNGK